MMATMVSQLPGSRLGRYEVQEEIGRGGSAFVFRAYDAELDRDVALKVLPDYHSEEPSFIARFRQEAQAVAKLHHSNILQIHDFGEDRGFTYIVSKHVTGGTMDSRLGKRHSLAEVLALATPLAGALDYAHRQGIVHRDMKPSNVLMDADAGPVLADFGIARILESSGHLTRTGWILGTPQYMSPEQAKGLRVDHRSDIYSFAIVLYELLMGHPPFKAETPVATLLAHVHEPVPPVHGVEPDVDPGLETILVKALAKDPDHRYPASEELVGAMDGLSRRPEAGPAPTPPTGEFKASVSYIAADRPDRRPEVSPTASEPSSKAKEYAIRVFLVEDHQMLLEGLLPLIETDERFEVSGTASTAEEAFELLETLPCDVVVMDVSLGGMSGIEATRKMKAQTPQVKVLILSVHGEEYLKEAIAAGADGYVVKTSGATTLRNAIYDVHRGTSVIDPTLTRFLFNSVAGAAATEE